MSWLTAVAMWVPSRHFGISDTQEHGQRRCRRHKGLRGQCELNSTMLVAHLMVQEIVKGVLLEQLQALHCGPTLCNACSTDFVLALYFGYEAAVMTHESHAQTRLQLGAAVP